MKAYFIHPNLTIGENSKAQTFFEVCIKELDEHLEVVPLRSQSRLISSEVSKEDCILFFNREDVSYSSYVISFLEEACTNNSEVWPIAISKESRMPPKIVNKKQSFDVVENLRKRGLAEGNISSIALSLARTVISLMQPTLSINRMHIFISHRRIDGEEIASDFCKEIRRRVDTSAFRDLIDIQVGEDAQNIIEQNLKKSDVVVFLDTPLAGESYWIEKELEMALGMNIPIIWVKIGNSEGRINLRAKPADQPHFEIDYSKMDANEYKSLLIDEIIHKTFLIYREYAKDVFDKIHVIKNIAKLNGIDFSKLDTKNMIYKVTIPRRGFRYHQKPIIHIVQCFNRLPKNSEIDNFELLLNSIGYEKHPSHGSFYDTSILLAPIKSGNRCSEASCVVDSFDEYIHAIEKYSSLSDTKYSNKKGVIIIGSFPDCEPEHQQQLTNAVFAFVKEVFRRKAIVIFGAHPTFQNMIFNISMDQRQGEDRNLIHMYLSKFFVSDGAIDEYTKKATVIATENVNDSREKSLLLMRQAMINDESAVALVCIGGKTEVNISGVDEEIELAKAKGLPIFIIGSAGGRASELALMYSKCGWKNKLNKLSIEQNENFIVSLDYMAMAKEILDSLEI